MSAAPEPIIGIDLGTTNSLVAYCDERGPRIITSPDGQHRHLPSVVRIDPVTGRPEVGHDARNRAVERPTETVYSIKRLMGRGLADIAPELPFLPYAVADHPSRSMVEVVVGDHRYTPQQISAMILAELKRWASADLGVDVRKAVVTVPAYFDDAQRQATRDAGAIAGLEIVRIVNEPTAAALAYGLDRAESATLAVYDLGGGTFDVSILRIENGVFRVLSTNGDTHLGGDDLDRSIIALVQAEIETQLGHPVQFPPSTQQALRSFAEAVKVRLSSDTTATLEIAIGEGQTYRRTLTRPELEALARPLIQRSLDRCKLALRDAGNPAKSIDRIILVGGTTYMPLVRSEVSAFFAQPAYTALNPMEIVALGASVQAAILARINRSLLLQDIIPLSLGIETMGGAVAKIITKGRSLPCAAEEIFSTYVDGQTNIKLQVLQGERELAKDCRSLGEFILSGIPPMPAGIPKLKVKFVVDTSGILTVSATEERSGTAASLQIVPSYGLTRDEVSTMVRDAVTHARADMLEHRLIDLRNQVTLDTAAIEKSLRIAGPDLPPADRADIESRLAELRHLAQSQDAEAIHTALTTLDRLTTPLAELAISKTLRGL